MKAHLLYRDRDFDWAADLPANADDLRADLELPVVLAAMAGTDKYLHNIATRVLLASLGSAEQIHYRQDVLADCIANEELVRGLHDHVSATVTGERRLHFFGSHSSPSMILNRAIEVLNYLLGPLQQLRDTAAQAAPRFRSEGLLTFCRMLSDQLDDDYFAEVRAHLANLSFRGAVTESARLGSGMHGAHYVLRAPNPDTRAWWHRIGSPVKGPSIVIADRDEAGARTLNSLRDRGINLVANAAAQSADHILNFLRAVDAELCFYIGCLNLRQRLLAGGYPMCRPEPGPPGQPALDAVELRDVALCLTATDPVVGNEVHAADSALIVITGANTGGKSTTLRSLGAAQLMMQAGMFVAAQQFRAPLRNGVFTHYRREEDTSLRSGKFDEELDRMSTIADELHPGAVVLFNESFAATNEREGSEIARQIIHALADGEIAVWLVTHLYDLASSLYHDHPDALFLRAERRADGARTFKLTVGEPLSTSYGRDLYETIFTDAPPSPAGQTVGSR